MKKLLLSRNDIKPTGENPDVELWHNIYKLIPLNVSLVDRCDYIQGPYQFANKFPIPRDLAGFTKTYEDICQERAEQLLAHSRRVGKPLMLLYSGGIDSTTVVISFIKAAGANTRDITIALNPASIQENVRFYFEHIRGNFRMVASERMLDMLTGDYIMVGGEFNDQLFGSDILLGYKNIFGFDQVLGPYSADTIVPFFVASGMNQRGAEFWYHLLDEQIRATNLCEIKTVRDFFWWYNFCFKWQSVYYRIVSRTNHRELVNDQFLQTYYHQFFGTDDFQKWSMLNPDKKIVDTWESYKITAKEMIRDFTGDEEYFRNKMKLGSLSGIFKKRAVPDALAFDDATNEYIFLDHMNREEFYNPNNSFKQRL